jgi:hypothetical protein
MTVYKPLVLDRYELCHPIDRSHFRKITNEINGVPRLSTWKPIAMEIIHEDEGQRLLESDSPWLGSDALIFRAKAIDALGSLLRESGELLPLVCDEAELWLFNPTRVVDALDEAASDTERVPTGRIVWINRYVFKPEVLRGIDIFKISTLRVSPVFLGERFVERWTSAGLKGLEFVKVWTED